MRRWLTDRVIRVVVWRAAQLSPGQQDWGEAIVAELAAVPDGGRRFRWALGSLWFVLSRGDRETASVPNGTRSSWRWATALLGILTVAPWLVVSVFGMMERDAPDATFRSMTVMLAAEVILVAAFLANWRRASGRAARAVLLSAVAGYGAAAAFSALDNVGQPAAVLVAPLIFAGPPLLAALPMLRRA
jgi:hypothetical protein